MELKQKIMEHGGVEVYEAVLNQESMSGRMAPMSDNDSQAECFGWDDERGVGVVEIILILVVLIALVAIFKTQLTNLVNTIFSTISRNAGSVMR